MPTPTPISVEPPSTPAPTATPAPAVSESAPAIESGITLIVNAKNTASRLTATEVANYFLKRRRVWEDGTDVRFIDRKDGSKARASFFADILKRKERDLELYWIGQKLYSGDAAPMQVESDESVASLVGSLAGAIGYVSSGYECGPGVKKIPVRGDAP